uniref:Uncharacterized protein n=1 Tax=Neogobius melanostomus TaxID=47308 RepID=A0A8C6SDK8_9GOBI
IFPKMSEHHEQKAGKRMVSNWLEERAVAHIDTAETQNQIQKYGHRGLLSMELGAKMEDVTTVTATYVQHQGPGVRLKETTHRMKSAVLLNGAVSVCSQVHDYKSENAVSFWSENHQKIQGLTPVPSASAPFRKCSDFSRPIGERLDEVDPPLDD